LIKARLLYTQLGFFIHKKTPEGAFLNCLESFDKECHAPLYAPKIRKFGMIDFLKIQINDTNEIERLWARDELVFHDYKERLSHFDFETLTTKSTKQYQGILFCKFETKLEILLRPHYQFNHNLHNANDFGIADCIQLLQSLMRDLEIKAPEQYKIVNIEFGANLVLANYGKELVQYACYWKKTLLQNLDDMAYFKRNSSPNLNGRTNNFKIIKLYSKGVQFPQFCNKNTIRFEIKSKQYKYIKTLGVESFLDLLNVEVYSNLKNELVNASKHLLFLDQTIDTSKLDIREANQLKKYLNPFNWYKVGVAKGNGFWEQKKRYLGLLKRNDLDVHNDFTNELVKKLEKLSLKEVDEKCMNSTPSNQSFQKRNMYEFHNSISGKPPFLIFPNTNCQVTGMSLKNEGPFTNPDQFPKYIRTKSLRHIREHDPDGYMELVEEFIPNKAKRPKFEKSEIQHLAKQIRNRHYNAKRKKLKQPLG